MAYFGYLSSEVYYRWLQLTDPLRFADEGARREIQSAVDITTKSIDTQTTILYEYAGKKDRARKNYHDALEQVKGFAQKYWMSEAKKDPRLKKDPTLIFTYFNREERRIQQLAHRLEKEHENYVLFVQNKERMINALVENQSNYQKELLLCEQTIQQREEMHNLSKIKKTNLDKCHHQLARTMQRVMDQTQDVREATKEMMDEQDEYMEEYEKAVESDEESEEEASVQDNEETEGIKVKKNKSRRKLAEEKKKKKELENPFIQEVLASLAEIDLDDPSEYEEDQVAPSEPEPHYMGELYQARKYALKEVQVPEERVYVTRTSTPHRSMRREAALEYE
jgi:hypothetical protein